MSFNLYVCDRRNQNTNLPTFLQLLTQKAAFSAALQEPGDEWVAGVQVEQIAHSFLGVGRRQQRHLSKEWLSSGSVVGKEVLPEEVTSLGPDGCVTVWVNMHSWDNQRFFHRRRYHLFPILAQCRQHLTKGQGPLC